jgi:hypothetical protein
MTEGTRASPRRCTKAFKGKGELRQRLHEVERQLEVLRRRMRQLKDQTRSVRGRLFALETYVKRGAAAMNLRWRLAVGKHALWERDIEPALDGFPADMQAWYRRTNVAALILNVQERCLRYEAVALGKLLLRLRE